MTANFRTFFYYCMYTTNYSGINWTLVLSGTVNLHSLLLLKNNSYASVCNWVIWSITLLELFGILQSGSEPKRFLSSENPPTNGACTFPYRLFFGFYLEFIFHLTHSSKSFSCLLFFFKLQIRREWITLVLSIILKSLDRQCRKTGILGLLSVAL